MISGVRRMPAHRSQWVDRSRHRRRLRGDDGTSLVEMLVGMTLMSIFMVLFTGAILMMNKSMNQSQAVNATASQLNTAYANLDNTVRYATFISTPGVSTGTRNWYVELRSFDAGVEQCTQLRVNVTTQQLQSRSWTVSNGVAGTAGAWRQIAAGISNGGAVAGATTQPFYLIPADTSTVSQQLVVNLIAPAGSGSAQVNSLSTFTLTAVNSTVPAPVARICQQQGRQ